jgi:WD40 repeat protein
VSYDNTARVWDAASERELATLRGHTDKVTNAAWSPDGKQIVTASWDQTARVWGAASGRELATLRGHTDKVTNAAWSPDGKQIVTASYDNTARIYLTHIEDLIALAKSRLSRELTCEERERYLHEPRCPTPTPTRTPTSVPTRTLTPKP